MLFKMNSVFERRGREGYAKDAKEKQPNFGFLFCDLCEVFAPSAFKKCLLLYFAAATVTNAGRSVRSAIVKPFCKTATIVLASCVLPSGAGTT